MTTTDEVHLSRLSSFVVRARRVEEHSLTADRPRFYSWAVRKSTFRIVDGVPRAVRWDLPSEEALESLAARCRPFLLNNDPVYHQKFLGSLGYFLREAGAEKKEPLQRLRSTWQDLNPSTEEKRIAYQSRSGEIDGQPGPWVADKKLAYAWLYGDLVHADDNIPDRVGGHDIDARFQAGCFLIASAAIQAIATLNFVRQLQNEGVLHLPPEVFEQRVNARPPEWLSISAMAVGPEGTSVEQLEGALAAATEATGAARGD